MVLIYDGPTVHDKHTYPIEFTPLNLLEYEITQIRILWATVKSLTNMYIMCVNMLLMDIYMQ